MPKFKDLGINVIPLTMQPPEIGDGGGGPQCPKGHTREDGCDKEKTTDRYEECGVPCTTDKPDQCGVPCTTDKPDQCELGGTTDRYECQGPGTTDCQEQNLTTDIPPKSPGRDKRDASPFSAEAVAQLRQQIESRTTGQL